MTHVTVTHVTVTHITVTHVTVTHVTVTHITVTHVTVTHITVTHITVNPSLLMPNNHPLSQLTHCTANSTVCQQATAVSSQKKAPVKLMISPLYYELMKV